jgi:hypothetical protein
MAISDIAQATQNADPLPWRTCGVCHALATIPEAEAEGLRALLRGKLRYSEISDLIADDPDTPLQIDKETLSRHARGGCSARERLRKSAN